LSAGRDHGTADLGQPDRCRLGPQFLCSASGESAGAVLDVTDEEPLPRESPLWQAPNALLTQHTAGGSAGELEGKTEVFLANLTRYRAGHPLTNVVDWAKGY
jgi:glyoxylate/hydroxypyruvate reductase A